MTNLFGQALGFQSFFYFKQARLISHVFLLRERERERERERDRERETETETESDRDRERQRETETVTERERDPRTHIFTKGEIERMKVKVLSDREPK